MVKILLSGLIVILMTSCGPGFLNVDEEPDTSNNDGPWKPQDFEGDNFISIQEACTNFFRGHAQIIRKNNKDRLNTDPLNDVCHSILNEFLDIKKPSKETHKLAALNENFKEWLKNNFMV